MNAAAIDYVMDEAAAGEEIKYADSHVQASLCLVAHDGAYLVTWSQMFVEGLGGGYCYIDGDTYRNREAGARAFRDAVRVHVADVQHWDIAAPRFAKLLAWLDEQCGERREVIQLDLFS